MNEPKWIVPAQVLGLGGIAPSGRVTHIQTDEQGRVIPSPTWTVEYPKEFVVDLGHFASSCPLFGDYTSCGADDSIECPGKAERNEYDSDEHKPPANCPLRKGPVVVRGK